jgi:hypothetical protein
MVEPEIIGVDYKGGLFSPSTVMSEMDTVTTWATALAHEIGASDAPEVFKFSYSNFYKEWKSFYESHKGLLNWPKRVLNTTYAKVLEFKERVREWRKKFKELGGETITPITTKEAYGSGLSRFSFKSLIIGTGVVVGGYFLLKHWAKN